MGNGVLNSSLDPSLDIYYSFSDKDSDNIYIKKLLDNLNNLNKKFIEINNENYENLSNKTIVMFVSNNTLNSKQSYFLNFILNNINKIIIVSVDKELNIYDDINNSYLKTYLKNIINKSEIYYYYGIYTEDLTSFSTVKINKLLDKI